MQYCVFQLLYDFKLKFGADKAAAVANNLKLLLLATEDLMPESDCPVRIKVHLQTHAHTHISINVYTYIFFIYIYIF